MKRHVILLFLLMTAGIAVGSAIGDNVIPIDLQKGVNAPEYKSMEDHITATLNGHTVSVSFSSDFGSVTVSVETESGSTVNNVLCAITPNGATLYVPGTGNFVLVIETQYGTFEGEFTILEN